MFNRSIRRKGVLLFALASASCFAITPDQPLNKSFDYEINNGEGSWVKWASPKYADCEVMGGWSDGHYVVDVDLTDAGSVQCSYLYIQLPDGMPLWGDVNLTADISVEVLFGTVNATPRVRLGFDYEHKSYAYEGGTVQGFDIAASASGWQSIGGSINAAIDKAKQAHSRRYALSTVDDLLLRSTGPVIYIFKDSIVKGESSRLKLRLAIDNVAITGMTSEATAYDDEAEARGESYRDRIAPVVADLERDIENARQGISAIEPLAHYPDAQIEMSGQAAELASAYDILARGVAGDDKKKGYKVIKNVRVPNVAEFEKAQQIRHSLQKTHALYDHLAAMPAGVKLLHYPGTHTTTHSYLDHVFESKGQPGASLSATMAQEEFEPLSFVIQNIDSQALTVNSVDTASLTNAFGVSFPSDHLDLRVVKQWYVGSKTSIGATNNIVPIIADELLLHDDSLVRIDRQTEENSLKIKVDGVDSYANISVPGSLIPHDARVEDAAELQAFTIPALASRQLWLTANSYDGVLPGEYAGNITVHFTREGVAGTLDIPTMITILPVVLPKSEMDNGLYYNSKISENYYGLQSVHRSRQQYMAELINMREHGIDYPTQYLVSDDITSNREQVAQHYGLREEAGLACDKVFLLFGIANIVETTSLEDAFNHASQLISAVGDSVSCNDYDTYLYGQDEADDLTVLERQRAPWQRAQAAGAKIMVAGASKVFDDSGDILDTTVFDVVGDILDTIVLYGKYGSKEYIAQWRAAGKDVYSYSNPQVGLANPSIYRYNYGLFLWQQNYTGSMNYAYQDTWPNRGRNTIDPNLEVKEGFEPTDLTRGACNNYQPEGYCSSWNDFDSSKYFDHMFTYPTSSGVVDTVQWEAMREAIDDTRYLALLNQLKVDAAAPVAMEHIEDWMTTTKELGKLNPDQIKAEMQALAMASIQEANTPPVLSSVEITTLDDVTTISGEAADPEGYLADVRLSLDGGEPVSVGVNTLWQYSWVALSPGQHTVTAVAVDYLGAKMVKNYTVEIPSAEVCVSESIQVHLDHQRAYKQPTLFGSVEVIRASGTNDLIRYVYKSYSRVISLREQSPGVWNYLKDGCAG